MTGCGAASRVKWRPRIVSVVAAVLGVVAVLPLAGMAAVVVLSRSPAAVLSSLEANGGKIALMLAVVAFATFGAGLLLVRLILTPVTRLSAAATSASAGFGGKAAPPDQLGTREMADLAAAFFGTLDRLRERGRYLETYTAHVSHELKSPLTSILGASELMIEAGGEMDPETRNRFLLNVAEDARRLESLVRRMRELARADMSVEKGQSELRPLMRQLEAAFPALRFETLTHGETPPSLPLTRHDAALVLAHLADNALRHGASRVEVSARAPDGRCTLTVGNDGDAIPPGDASRIFEPFFTTRRDEGGTGMGLEIVRSILRSHGATIALGGTRPVLFEIRF